MLWDQNLQRLHAVVDNLVVDNNPEAAVEDNIQVEAVDSILAVGSVAGDDVEAGDATEVAGDATEVAGDATEADDETGVPDDAEVVVVDEPGRS